MNFASRAALFSLVSLSIAGCKAHPKSDLPLLPGCNQLPSGGDLESPAAIQFHVMLSCSDNAAQVHRYYQEELVKKRGWTEANGAFTQGPNLEHTGDIGRSGYAKVADPSQPGGWVAIVEFSNYTEVDLWQSVPKRK